jgi:hypothetical protein
VSPDGVFPDGLSPDAGAVEPEKALCESPAPASAAGCGRATSNAGGATGSGLGRYAGSGSDSSGGVNAIGGCAIPTAGAGGSTALLRPSGDAESRPCWRAASTRPDDSASPAAATTSAAARPAVQGRGSPQTGQTVMPSWGPRPPAWVWTISHAVRASTLSGFTYFMPVSAMPSHPRRSPATGVQLQVHRVRDRAVTVSANR